MTQLTVKDKGIHVADINTEMLFTIKNSSDNTVIDISTATTKNIVFRKADRTPSVQAASFNTDGTDGVLKFTSPNAAFFNVAGRWKAQGSVVISSGTFKSSTLEFDVFSNLVES